MEMKGMLLRTENTQIIVFLSIAVDNGLCQFGHPIGIPGIGGPRKRFQLSGKAVKPYAGHQRQNSRGSMP
jgi:hypothetical protein